MILPLPTSNRYDKLPIDIALGESSIKVDNETLIQRCHVLRQQSPRLDIDTLKFLVTRVNPPRCVSLVLEALSSLVYGICDKIDYNFYGIADKRYSLFKRYFNDIDAVADTLSHLKLFLET